MRTCENVGLGSRTADVLVGSKLARNASVGIFTNLQSVQAAGTDVALDQGDAARRAGIAAPRTGVVRNRAACQGSTFIIVLWIAFGLVSIALYFASSTGYELRAADNRVSGLGAEQAIDGAIRYVNYLLSMQIQDGSNGIAPDVTSYQSEAVSVGDSHFWLIGRDTNNPVGPGQMAFGLVDEAAKININSASSNVLAALVDSLPQANQDITSAILDWRDTNGGAVFQTYYATRPQPYLSKSAPFETIDELRLLYGGEMETLIGEDANRNGILDPNETDLNHDGQLEPGLLEYTTVYSREPNTRTNGDARINISVLTGATGPIPTLLQTALGQARADQILLALGLQGSGPVGPRQNARVVVTRTFTSPLAFFRASRMTADEFAKIADDITVTNGFYINGRININTASAAVLGALPGLNTSPDQAQTLITYRQSNPDKLGSIAWVVEALGTKNSTVEQALEAVDCITTRSYQFSADIAALGPNGRGYRRARVVFDTAGGTPKIIYRQDLTHLGWALGKNVRQTWLYAKSAS
jgi:type II secretory pathway component PulK